LALTWEGQGEGEVRVRVRVRRVRVRVRVRRVRVRARVSVRVRVGEGVALEELGAHRGLLRRLPLGALARVAPEAHVARRVPAR